MQDSTPLTGDSFRLTEGPFYAADVCALTRITPTQLQHWINKGYLGKDKVGLGRGAIRTYTAGEVEVLAVAKELVDCGALPQIALEYAALIVHKAELVLADHVAARQAAIAQGAMTPNEAIDDLQSFMPSLIATVRMNPSAGEADAVQILSGGRFSINEMFPDMRPATFVPVGMIKITLGRLLQEIELSKPTRRRSTKPGKSRVKKSGKS